MEQCPSRSKPSCTASSRTRIPAFSQTIREKKVIDDALKAEIKNVIDGIQGAIHVGGRRSGKLADAQPDRHPAAHPLGQEHAADHQGHENGLGGEAAPRAGARDRGASVRRACCSEMLANVAAAAAGNEEIGESPLLTERPEKRDPADPVHLRPRSGRRIQRAT